MTVHTEVQFIQFCIQYSSLALIYYDYFLTLPREVTYVWKRPFHILTVLYFFCRYSLLSNIIFGAGLYEKSIGASCDTLYILSASIGLLGRIGIVSIIGTRTCAVYQYNRIVVGIFGALGTLVAGLAVAHIPTVSCSGNIVAKNPNLRIATDLLSTSTVVFEVLSTIFVVAACVRNMRSLGGYKTQKNGLIMLMFREGVAYTAFVTTLTTTAMILNYAAPLGSFFQRLLNAYTIPISGIVTARFLLHVREWQGGSGALPSHISFELDLGALENDPTAMSSANRDSGSPKPQGIPYVRRGSDDSNISDSSLETIETYGGHSDFVAGNLGSVAVLDRPTFQPEWSQGMEAGSSNITHREDVLVENLGQERAMMPTSQLAAQIMGWDDRAKTSSMV